MATALLDQTGVVAVPHCSVAETVPARLRGLLGRRGLKPGEGLLLRPASSVHTAFMRFPIDVAFLDHDLRVIKVTEDLRPWRMAGRRGARAVLERSVGECARRGIVPGARLHLR